jgi:hypothetical protein
LTPEEKKELEALCLRISQESDQHEFMALVIQLNNLLARKDRRLDDEVEA